MKRLKRRELKDVLSYAFGGDVPEGFLEQLVARRGNWDPVFRRRLDDFAYELWPDRAVWEIGVDEAGRLLEKRVPFVS